MVFAYLRDVYNCYFGNRYPRPELIDTLKEREPELGSTALVRYTKRDLVPKTCADHPPQLPENWVETHPSESVCIRQIQSRHEEF